MSLFLTGDGTWGDATDLVIIDNGQWSEEDMTVFEEMTDLARQGFADLYREFSNLRPTWYVTMKYDM